MFMDLTNNTQDYAEQYKSNSEGFTVERKAWVAPVVEHVKILSGADGAQKVKDGFTHVATIPPIVLDFWLTKNKIKMSDFIKDINLRRRFLHDPDYADLRIWKGTF